MILTDKEIKKMKLISPIVDKVQCPLSYGLEPTGYTLRLDNVFKVLKNDKTLDPMNKNLTESSFDNIFVQALKLMPHSFVLGVAVEKFNLPNNVTAIALTKSSYARVGVFANITTIDAGFKGDLVIEIANLGSNPVWIYAGYGIAEVLFFKHNETKGYEGNYQNQKGIKV